MVSFIIGGLKSYFKYNHKGRDSLYSLSSEMKKWDQNLQFPGRQKWPNEKYWGFSLETYLGNFNSQGVCDHLTRLLPELLFTGGKLYQITFIVHFLTEIFYAINVHFLIYLKCSKHVHTYTHMEKSNEIQNYIFSVLA